MEMLSENSLYLTADTRTDDLNPWKSPRAFQPFYTIFGISINLIPLEGGRKSSGMLTSRCKSAKRDEHNIGQAITCLGAYRIFQLLDDLLCPFRRIPLVQRCCLMGIEIVHYENFFSIRMHLICKFCSNGTPILKSAVHSF